MKRRLEGEGSPLEVPHKKIPSIQAEFHPVETSTDTSNDFWESLMNLPFELKQRIIYSLTPKERLPLRLVNKAMLDAVDTSMSDLERIDITFPEDLTDTYCVWITTINPYNGTEKTQWHNAVPSSLPFLLKWAGAQLKMLLLYISSRISEEEDFDWSLLYRVFEALIIENTCPKLKDLSLNIGQSLWDNDEWLFSDILQYVTKRQLQAKATDHPTPFLHSLSLISPLESTPSETSVVEPLDCEERRKFVQDILDQCHGLKELDVDDLLVQKDLPIVALRYPMTLTYLKSGRLNEKPGALQTILGNYPNLQIVDLDVCFSHDDAEVHALASLSALRELTLESGSREEEIVQMTAKCLAAFEDHPFGASVARPWPQLRSVTLNCRRDGMEKSPFQHLLLIGTNCSISSLHLTRCLRWNDNSYVDSVKQLFKALINEDACPNLMELHISSCELSNRIAESLATIEDRHELILQRSSKSFNRALPVPRPFFYGLLNDLLAYVTKRQSAVRLGKPFLHSLSITHPRNYCLTCDFLGGSLGELQDQLEQTYTTVQQILDQCHGLELLHMESLENREVNPNKKNGKELMELVPLRFPTTLKKLNGVSLN